mmetsp:Transcript_13067/g.37352  ORF Transcript_13067/g.37352 Transcript_13067/m.37352 type:complete len:384 (-) Transcript_13067:376-1527(-)
MAIFKFVERPALVGVLTSAIQVLTGWMWKGFVGAVIYGLQGVYLEDHQPEEQPTEPTPYGPLIRFGCFGVALGMALAFTIPAMLTAFLPPGGEEVDVSSILAFAKSYVHHLSVHLAGATALPFAFGWYITLDTLLLMSTSHKQRLDENGQPLRDPAEDRRMIGVLLALRVVLVCTIILLIGAMRLGLIRLYDRLEARAVRTENQRMVKVVMRTRAISQVACNFLLAWPAFDIPSHFWKAVGGDTCYPRSIPPVISGSLGWVAILITCFLLTALILIVTHEFKREHARVCRSRVLAESWTTVTATFPIMLGWSIKDLYLEYIANDSFPYLSVIIVFSLIILVALLVIYDTIRQRHMHRAEQSGDDKVNPDTKPMERANLEQTCI